MTDQVMQALNPALLSNVKTEEVQFELARRKFSAFVKLMWPVIEPGTELTWAWYIDAICDHLQAITDGKIRKLIINIPPRHLKALESLTKTLTPNGWKNHGDLVAGDLIAHPSGGFTRVMNVAPDTSIDYEVEFTNGEIIRCNGAHLWTVYDRPNRKWSTLETTQIEQRAHWSGDRAMFQLPTVAPLEGVEQELPIPPYILGAWLGDGSSNAPLLTHHAEDTQIKDRFEELGAICHSSSFDKNGTGISRFNGTLSGQILRENNLFKNKHIPDAYMRASLDQRLELLAGLVDTDGHVDETGRVRFSQVEYRKELFDQVVELARSLGCRVGTCLSEPCHTGFSVGNRMWCLAFNSPIDIPLQIPRKGARLKTLPEPRKIGIKHIRKLDKPVVGNCITVEADDGLYLAGKQLVPTHNSSLVSVLWPAWEWLQKPYTRYLSASYHIELAKRDAVKTRRVMQSQLYRQLNAGRFTMSADQNLKDRYENDQMGHRICTSPTSKATGEGGDRIMVDDPHNVATIDSDITRTTAVHWWGKTMFSRANDPKASAYLIIMQRVHDNDLTGEVLANDPDYEHLCLPMMFEKDHPHKSHTSLNFVDPRTEEGELLCPERFGDVEIAAARKSLGSMGFAGQYQQRPAPAEGLVFRYDWFPRWSRLPPHFDRIVSSWDLAFTGQDEYSTRARATKAALSDPAYVVGQVWGFFGSKAYLLDEYRGKWGITNTIKQIKRMKSAWPQVSKVLIEEKANGAAVLELLDGKIPGLKGITPQGDKVQRAWATLPYIEAGDVFLPQYPWVDDWLEEVCMFPNRKNKDRVDAMTQVLIHELGGGSAKVLDLLKSLTAW